jgi:hypothetical protein
MNQNCYIVDLNLFKEKNFSVMKSHKDYAGKGVPAVRQTSYQTIRKSLDGTKGFVRGFGDDHSEIAAAIIWKGSEAQAKAILDGTDWSLRLGKPIASPMVLFPTRILDPEPGSGSWKRWAIGAAIAATGAAAYYYLG